MSQFDLDTANPATLSDSIATTDREYGPGPRFLGASSLVGDSVHNWQGDDLGSIKEIMLDTERGTVAYAVLSFGGWLGMGDKLFAVPWQALSLDPNDRAMILDVSKERLKSAPGFDKDRWPDMVDPAFAASLNGFYLSTPPLRR